MQKPRPENKRTSIGSRPLQPRRLEAGYRGASGTDSAIGAVAPLEFGSFEGLTARYFHSPESEQPLTRDGEEGLSKPKRPRTALGPGGGRSARGERRTKPSQSEIGRRLDIRA